MMTSARRAAALLFPLVAAVSLEAAPASAARVSACNPVATGYIANSATATNPVGVGVIRDWRGRVNDYGMGLYDAVLPIGQRTDCAAGFGWVDAEAYYSGPGFCVTVSAKYDGRWRPIESTGPGQHRLPDWERPGWKHEWLVSPYRC